MVSKQDAFAKFEELYWQVSRSMNYIWKQIFEEHFPGSQAYVLFLLEKKGKQKMTELAETLNLTPGAVTSSSDKLIEGGFIQRVRDEKDRRVVYLEITNEGKAAMEDLRKEGRKAIKTIFGGLPEADVKHLVRIFEHASEKIDHFREEFGVWSTCQKKEK